MLRGKSNTLHDRMLVVQFSRVNVGRPKKYDAAVMWRRWRLVNGNQLFDLSRDPHQDRNLFDRHPDLAARMKKHYDQWWATVEPGLDEFQPSVIGSPKENPTRLCACEWADVFLDQSQQVRLGTRANGTWHVEVEREGSYEIALRRWPKEADVPISASLPPHLGEDGRYPPGAALPIARARLRVGTRVLEADVGPEDRQVVFTLTLPRGRTTLKTWFYNRAGKEICGAYYVYIRRQVSPSRDTKNQPESKRRRG